VPKLREADGTGGRVREGFFYARLLPDTVPGDGSWTSVVQQVVELMRRSEGTFSMSWTEVMNLDLETFAHLRELKEELVDLQSGR